MHRRRKQALLLLLRRCVISKLADRIEKSKEQLGKNSTRNSLKSNNSIKEIGNGFKILPQ